MKTGSRGVRQSDKYSICLSSRREEGERERGDREERERERERQRERRVSLCADVRVFIAGVTHLAEA